ncbi:MAG: hypothetical protein NC177_10860 [Ruminococcus flavefaciens]|nr:hypothetical protein [Ruminococcus flavefaciens]
MAEKILLIIFSLLMIWLSCAYMSRIADMSSDDRYLRVPKILYRIIHPLRKSECRISRRELLYFIFIYLPSIILCTAIIIVAVTD